MLLRTRPHRSGSQDASKGSGKSVVLPDPDARVDVELVPVVPVVGVVSVVGVLPVVPVPPLVVGATAVPPLTGNREVVTEGLTPMVGNNCDLACFTSARAALNWASAKAMFWFEMVTCSSREFN